MVMWMMLLWSLPMRPFRAEWSEQYKLARQYLYGSEDVPQDFR
jgi:hypothetical protein